MPDEKMTDDIKKFQDFAIDLVTTEIKEHGDVNPVLILLSKKNSGGYNQLICQIPEILMENGGFKDLLTQEIIPSMIVTSKEHNGQPLCTVFITEAWIRAIPYKDYKGSDFAAYQQHDKQEVVICIFETPKRNWSVSYLINRLPDGVTLTEYNKSGEMDLFSGRFTGLFKKALEHEQRIKN